MSKQIIHTDAAPAAVGPYSQAVAVSGGKTVYLSGQIGLEPGTGDLVSENFDAQVRQAFANMQEVIKAAGGTLDNVVKLTLFLTDLGKFAAANAIMAEIIPQPSRRAPPSAWPACPRARSSRSRPSWSCKHHRGISLPRRVPPCRPPQRHKRASAAKGGAGKPLTDTERKLRNLVWCRPKTSCCICRCAMKTRPAWFRSPRCGRAFPRRSKARSPNPRSCTAPGVS